MLAAVTVAVDGTLDLLPLPGCGAHATPVPAASRSGTKGRDARSLYACGGCTWAKCMQPLESMRLRLWTILPLQAHGGRNAYAPQKHKCDWTHRSSQHAMLLDTVAGHMVE